jgi:hypothetical protein
MKHIFVIFVIFVILAVLGCGCTSPREHPSSSDKCYSDNGIVTSKTIQTSGTSSFVWRLYFITIDDNTMYEVSSEHYGSTHIGQRVTVSHCVDGRDELADTTELKVIQTG